MTMLITRLLLLASTALLFVNAQNLCNNYPPQCNIQYNGIYWNCYCVYNNDTQLYDRIVTRYASSDDNNLCSNVQNTTFCCARGNVAVFNDKVYDSYCTLTGDYTPPPQQQTTEIVDEFAFTIVPIPTVTETITETMTETCNTEMPIETNTEMPIETNTEMPITIIPLETVILIYTLPTTTMTATEIRFTVYTVPDPSLVETPFFPVETITTTITATETETATKFTTRLRYRTSIIKKILYIRKTII